MIVGEWVDFFLLYVILIPVYMFFITGMYHGVSTADVHRNHLRNAANW